MAYSSSLTGKKTTVSDEQYSKMTPGLQSVFTKDTPAQNPQPSPLQNPVPASNLQPATPVKTPEPTAPTKQAVMNDTMQGAVDQSRQQLDKMYADQKAAIDKQLADLQKEQAKILKDAKPLTDPFREDLEKKERARLQVDENYQANQKLVNELDGLLTESNALIARSRGLPMNNRAGAIRTNRSIQDVQARAGVIQAVMSARSNQISAAYTMIDRTTEAIVADRTDSLNYYNTLLDLNKSKELTLDKESKAIAEEQVNLVKGDLERAQKTADYIKGLMIDPDTAQFMADAGITMTDSIEDIQAKMAKQAKIKEAQDMKNELVGKGYQFLPYPSSDPNVVSFDVGGQTMYFKEPQDVILDRQYKQAQINATNAEISEIYRKAKETGMSWSERKNVLELAEAGDPDAIAALGYDPAKTPTASQAKSVARDNAFAELEKVNGLLNNTLGISSSSGTFQSPLLAQMLGMGATGTAVGAAGGSFVGGIGAIPGAIGGGVLGLLTGAATGVDAKRQKENFLSQLDFVLSGDSFDKFRELRASGVTFGQTTEREWAAVQKAANELESAAKRDGDGKLIGFIGTESNLKRMLEEYQKKTQDFANTFVDEDSVDDVLGTQTMDEIKAFMQPSNPALLIGQLFNPSKYY